MTVALSPTPVLETDRLVLRAPAARDWAHWRDFFLSARGQWIRPEGTPTEEAAWRGWAGVIGHWVLRGWGPFVITTQQSDRGLGLVGPWAPINWPEFEIAWSIWAPEHEGRGIMAEAARLARDHAFRILGWQTAVSYIDPENTRSVALARRLGATPDAAAPFPGTPPITVYRHPKPEDLA
ncbi:GNAT family N-acetyltransferase [Rhodobacter xanthinilyticus]|uniref:GNAT family N-acetyltransferase n=1 Tax=Rhodobacter xanthinilyticus TaxID=1850250 RepID=A0A1D9M7U7_9RHOB|nr:GNAT family N-acetyltransferase [Rhodobacter xanthinilyticus]AOZ67925.1 GNAT family N-acetyltransferase [Rhodobacter xanthinilyticus]